MQEMNRVTLSGGDRIRLDQSQEQSSASEWIGEVAFSGGYSRLHNCTESKKKKVVCTYLYQLCKHTQAIRTSFK